jgi:hypothetical protein
MVLPEALWAERGGQLRLPTNTSRSHAVGKLWLEGVAEPKEFRGISKWKKDRPTTDLTQPPRHVMKFKRIPQDEYNAGIPDHLDRFKIPIGKILTPEEERIHRGEKRKWLESVEGETWIKAQQLDDKTHAFGRDHDAEANMFEDLLAYTSKDSTGEFHFKVDRTTCAACQDMIFRFGGMRPGIKVIQH